MSVLIAFALFTTLFSLMATRMSNTLVTAPMAFIGFGVVVSLAGGLPEQIFGGGAERLLHLVAEVALVVLLFLDAAKIDSLSLGRQHAWPVRMLLLGLPLALLFGAGLTALLFPEWRWRWCCWWRQF